MSKLLLVIRFLLSFAAVMCAVFGSGSLVKGATLDASAWILAGASALFAAIVVQEE